LNTFHSLLKKKNYLLIFENAEFLIDILHQQKNQKNATIYSVIQKCKKSLFFTTNIHLVDIHELQYVINVDKRDTIPNNIRQIRNKYENKKSFALSQFNELFLQPSTRMMAQFIVVLGLVMNARQVYFKKNDTYSSTAHVTNQRRKNKKAKKKTLKYRGGLLFPSAQGTMNYIVERLVVRLFSLPKMFLLAIWHTIKKNLLHETIAEKIQRNVSAFVSSASYLMFHESYRTSLKTLFRGLQNGVTSVVKQMLHLDENEHELVLSYLCLLTVAWLSSQIIQKYVYPTYNSQLKKDLGNSLCVACHEDVYSPKSQRMNTLFTKIRKRTVHYDPNIIPDIVAKTFELDKVKSENAKQNILQELLYVDSRHKYNQCKELFKLNDTYASNNKLRVVVIVPYDIDNDHNWVKRTDGSIYKEISINQIKTMETFPERNERNGQILFPAHEIHFITPPTNEERALVSLIYAGVHYKTEKTIARDPLGLGLNLSYSTKMSVTKLFEYVRPFSRLTSVLKGMQKTASSAKHTMQRAYKYANGASHTSPGQHHTVKVSTNTHELQAPEWFSIAIENIRSPEEHVSLYRRSLENEWKQLEMMICSDELEDYPIARKLQEKYNDYESSEQTKQTANVKQHHNEILSVYKKAIDAPIMDLNNSKESEIGKLTLRLEALKRD
jgi:hypothetical protein